MTYNGLRDSNEVKGVEEMARSDTTNVTRLDTYQDTVLTLFSCGAITIAL